MLSTLQRPNTIDDVLRSLPSPIIDQLPIPQFVNKYLDTRRRIAFAVDSMRDHMTDEGWQIFNGLQHNGYILCGYNLPFNSTNTIHIMDELNPCTVIIQDKREWDTQPGDFRDIKARFHNINDLARRTDTFKVTILKDSHQKPSYHKQSAEEMGCHAWIVYYNPRIVKHLAPYVRSQHLIRTYHTVDKLLVPPFKFHERLSRALLSGAISGVYPLRTSLVSAFKQGSLKHIDYLKHPGYHRRGSATPEFLKTLTCFKVSICTASIFGYALRKIIESTACGCRVITDLPVDEILPHIDENLIRVPSNTTPQMIDELSKHLAETYDYDKQESLAHKAKIHYDFRHVTEKITNDIETMRQNYNVTTGKNSCQ